MIEFAPRLVLPHCGAPLRRTAEGGRGRLSLHASVIPLLQCPVSARLILLANFHAHPAVLMCRQGLGRSQDLGPEILARFFVEPKFRP